MEPIQTPPAQFNRPSTPQHRIRHYLRTHWKELTLAVAVGFAASAMIYGLVFQSTFAQRRYVNVKGTDKIYSPLSGVETTQELAARPVTGIMIENSPDARPQSSISQAGVVFEAVAEGGITRYLVLYQENRPTNIGPVRSLRPYYLDWAMGYEAPVAHVGGSDQAIGLLRQRGARDLEQFTLGEKAFWRAGDRPAPHNVYTSFDKLDVVNREKGYTTSTFAPYKRKNDSPAAAPTHSSIGINYSSSPYFAEFRYDPAGNYYLRYLAGGADTDRENGQQLAAKNIVVMDMRISHDGKYAIIPSVASGTGTLYLDGLAVPVNWSKPTPTSMIELTDSAGQPVQLNRGLTWFAASPI